MLSFRGMPDPIWSTVLRRIRDGKTQQSLREIGIVRSILVTLTFSVLTVLIGARTIIPSIGNVIEIIVLFAISVPFVPKYLQIFISRKDGLLAESSGPRRFLVFQLPIIIVTAYVILRWFPS